MEYLKIKDEVDLKELEKYGFIREEITIPVLKLFFIKYKKEEFDAKIWVNSDDNIIWTSDNLNDDQIDLIMTTIFDLIQAGLVEKVVE